MAGAGTGHLHFGLVYSAKQCGLLIRCPLMILSRRGFNIYIRSKKETATAERISSIVVIIDQQFQDLKSILISAARFSIYPDCGWRHLLAVIPGGIITQARSSAMK